MAESTAPSLAFYRFGLFFNEQGQGVDRDVVDEVERRTGITFSASVEVRARIWSDLEAGHLDATVSGIATPQRLAFAWFAPYISIKNYVILPRRLRGTVTSFAEFTADPALRFGVVNSFRHGAAIDAALVPLREAGRVDAVATVEQLFAMLKAGRIDGMVAQPVTYRLHLPAMNLEETVDILDWTPTEAPVAHGLVLSRRRFAPDQAKQIIDSVAAMVSDGAMTTIIAKQLGIDEVQAAAMLPAGQ